MFVHHSENKIKNKNKKLPSLNYPPPNIGLYFDKTFKAKQKDLISRILLRYL